jgi:hypothetical protein
MSNKDKLSVGLKVYLKPVNNAARYGDKELREQVIKKIGKKYFFVGTEESNNERFWHKFDIEELNEVTNYSADWQFYFTKQDYLDDIEFNNLSNEIRGKFGSYGRLDDLTLDQLRRIKEIINE